MCKRLAEENVQYGFQSKDEPLLCKEPLHDPNLVARFTAERLWGSVLAPKPCMACIAAGHLAYIKGSARVNTFLALFSLAILDNMDLEKDLPSFSPTAASCMASKWTCRTAATNSSRT